VIADERDASESWILGECPRRFASEVVDAVNLAQMAEHHLPCGGGVMDQAAWWVDVWMAFKSDCSQIDADKAEREARRHG